MAEELRVSAIRLTFSIFLLCFFKFCVQLDSEVSRPCKAEDYEQMILPCDTTTKKRKAVIYMLNKCDPKANGSVPEPPQFSESQCDCPPGYGELLNNNYTFSCQKCQAGEYSHGGELISDWTNWNGTSGVPGSGFNLNVYCADFLTKKKCSMWRPEGNGEYIVSGDVKNGTELRCFDQSILVLNRKFVNKEGENYITFEYKVDGSACRKEESSKCANGLYVYVQNKRAKFKSDFQFQWLKQRIDVMSGPVQIKFVYQRSCTKAAILDVAYIKHLAMVGTASASFVCSKCPAGSFSNTTGSSECQKCSPNEFQRDEGKQTCQSCPDHSFSRIGEVGCHTLPNCTTNDYYLLPESTDKCRMVNNIWMRKQSVNLPEWPGKSKQSCFENNNLADAKYKRPANPDVVCNCGYGHYLEVTGAKPKCMQCPLGTYSNGKFIKCANCPEGSAALPGFYLNLFPEGNVPSIMKQECSGDFCSQSKNKQFWEHRGDYLATKRLPGNFETVLSFHDAILDYYSPTFSFNCSVDCRTAPGSNKLAKHDHCFLKIVVIREGKIIKDIDCVHRLTSQYRNGTIRKHFYNLKKPGNYTFKALFHHEDEAFNSMVSYEARIYGLEIRGSRLGSAKKCVKCPAGTRVSEDKALCEKCPPGFFSTAGSTTCSRCVDNTFSNKNGSGSCSPCGSGTTSNENNTGCDYNGCKFKAAKDVVYDFSALSVRGGPMYQVKIVKSIPNHYFPVLYYINLCSYDHDNSSCMVSVKEINQTSGKLVVVENRNLKTMACKRWGYSSSYSYSIGEVLSFIPRKENITAGLTITLTGGQKCWHRVLKNLSQPTTSIDMMCDLYRGVGQPESKHLDVQDSNCNYQFIWRTTYACPLCTSKDFSVVFSQCKDGEQTVTHSRINQCRTDKDVFTKIQSCKVTSSTVPSAPLVATIVIAIVFITILIAFVIYYVRRNRDLRDRLFVPGKTFSKVLDDDTEELVDNMIT